MNVNLKTPGIIEFELKSRESVIGESGSMSFCDGGISFGPLDNKPQTALKRLLAGESLMPFINFENNSSEMQKLSLRYDIKRAGWFHHNTTETNILPVDLSKSSGPIIAKSGAFFAATHGVTFELFVDGNIARSLLGFGKVFKQRIIGNGVVFFQKNRWLDIERIELVANKAISIDPKEVFAFSHNALQKRDGYSFKNFLSGEGFASYKFVGPGEVYIYKSMPAYGDDIDVPNLALSLIVWLLIFSVISTVFSALF